MVDTRGDRPRLLAGASSSWLGPQVWRSDDLGETWQETPNGAVRFPEGTDAKVERVWQLVAGAEPGVVYAGTEPGAVFRSTDGGETFELERALWDHPHRPRVERRLRRPGLPHDPPAPDRPGLRHRRALHRRRLPDQRRREVLGAAQPRHQGRVHARGAAVPRVRPVRAQGVPAPRPARAAVPAEPRRRLPLRRPRRELEVDRRRAARGVRVLDPGAPARPGHRLRVPDQRRRPSLPAGREGSGLALEGRRRVVGGARRGPAGLVLRRGDARRDVRRPAPRGRDLLRRPQRRRLGFGRLGGDLAAARQRAPGRDGRPRGARSRVCPP